MMPLWLEIPMYLTVIMTVAAVAWSGHQLVLVVRAERQLVRLLADRDEFRAVLRHLRLRVQQNGDLTFTEHEAIDLRILVHRAAACLPPAEQRQIVQGLYGPTVAGREGYLRYVLSASISALPKQAA
jgi:hypothetical protein